MMALRTPLAQLLATGNAALEVQGWILAGAMALTVIWAAYPALAGKREAAAFAG